MDVVKKSRSKKNLQIKMKGYALKKDLERWMATTAEDYIFEQMENGGYKRLKVFLQPCGYRYQVEADRRCIGKDLTSMRFCTIDEAVISYNKLV